MKTFLDITEKSYSFSSCNECNARCCDGREGTVFSQLILEDFEVVSKNFPILFTFGDLGYLKAVVFFTNGTGFCPYIQDNKCIIYEQRPSICRVYPLSPNVDNNIYIDDSCPAINTFSSNKIVENGTVTAGFMYKTLDNYQNKYIETHQELEKINNKNDFEPLITVNNITFYKYIGDIKNSYLEYHFSSLNNQYLNNLL
jgi:hypothetical protein